MIAYPRGLKCIYHSEGDKSFQKLINIINFHKCSLLVRLPLKMRDELPNCDLLRHLVVKILTVEHHGLQDGQGPLQHCCVHGRLVHIAGNLQEGQSRRDE